MKTQTQSQLKSQMDALKQIRASALRHGDRKTADQSAEKIRAIARKLNH